ncbi:MAG TPA: CehA/McbA family metallohydrolase [Verrucomicrobiae bacterium]|nr:CehA/McbA family metallohydrolase [Verrucomicrobiae bacterium]
MKAITITILCLTAAAYGQVPDARMHHLRSGTEAEWTEFEGSVPEGKRLDFRFIAEPNKDETSLFIRQIDVKLDWNVELNGRKLGKLFLMEYPLVHSLKVPPNTLRSGENILSILPPKENDDIRVGDFRFGKLDATLEVQVDQPCRITVADGQGHLAALSATNGRPGVVYTLAGKAKIALLPGEYTIYASRGIEYSVASTKVKLGAGDLRSVHPQIEREVQTPGLVSCDTHVHTFSYAKHGDATIEERMLTIAGEGLELPISTEHNMLVNFSEVTKKTGTEKYFTPVLGCEVTTKCGHFNAFPIKPGSRVPEFRIEDWPRLMENIRATPGVELVVLNHPRDTHVGFCPFAETNFNSVTGENLRGFEFQFDAVELINSGALRTDLMQVFHDWFALLNYGYRITGVGASDSHDVSRFIVGQGRTYIFCKDNDPAKIDIQEACASLRAGRALISLGLLVDMTVQGRFRVGDLATHLPDQLEVAVTVSAPKWSRPDHVELYANGKKLQETNTAKTTWTISRPKADTYLVAIATGPGITSPHWAIPKPYQPSSKKWNSRVLGATNPIWLDCDGDGKFTPLRLQK